MLKVPPAPEPPTFDANVRKEGERAIKEMVGEGAARRGRPRTNFGTRDAIPSEKFTDYWTRALGDLKTAYNYICAYSCFRIHDVTGDATVDHFIPKEWRTVYEWSNYRLACSLMNSRKDTHRDVLDPFLIQDNWFQLELVGFQVIPGRGLEETTRLAVQQTIDRLKLRDAVLCKAREKDATAYWDKKISLETLLEESPFVARELRRQGRLNPEDR